MIRSPSQNSSEAMKYLKMAVDQGNAQAMVIYAGTIFESGDKQKISEAATYFKILADQGDATAQYVYGILLQNGDGVSQDLSASGEIPHDGC